MIKLAVTLGLGIAIIGGTLLGQSVAEGITKFDTSTCDPRGLKGADGLSSMAKKIAKREKLQREVWLDVMRGNPELQEALKQLGEERFKAKSAEEMQHLFDSIHIGSGFKSNCIGQTIRD